MFNKIVIIGRLGFNPDLKTAKSGSQFCTFSAAVDTGWGDNKSTDWYNVTVFGKQAESCAKNLTKGSVVCVSGSIQLREYEAKDGSKKMRLELTADNVTFLSKRNSSEQSKPYGQQYDPSNPPDVEPPNPFIEDIPF